MVENNSVVKNGIIIVISLAISLIFYENLGIIGRYVFIKFGEMIYGHKYIVSLIIFIVIVIVIVNFVGTQEK